MTLLRIQNAPAQNANARIAREPALTGNVPAESVRWNAKEIIHAKT